MSDLDPILSVRPERERKLARRRRAVRALAVLFGILLVAAGVGAWYVLHAETDVEAGRAVGVRVISGMSSADIAEQLAQAGVVPNAIMFRIRARMLDLDGAFKTGVYVFKTGSDYDAVAHKLATGPDIIYYTVPIPEGFTARQVAIRLAKRAGLPQAELLSLVTTGAPLFAARHPNVAGAFRGSLEGYLFPATYQIRKGTSAQAVIDMMLTKFDDEAAGLDLTSAASGARTLRKAVIIASILQRETRLAREFPIVSSVIHNRLAKPMRLQLDSTVFYSLPPGTTVITSADLHNTSPYNTYAHAGLPAGPISNPGMAAIQAALHPATTKYYYYVLTGKDGSQTFTTTYADFLKAVAVYHKVFGK